MTRRPEPGRRPRAPGRLARPAHQGPAADRADVLTLSPEPSVGLSEIRLSDGPTGVRRLRFSGGPTVTLFPNATVLAASWDPDTLHQIGRLLAEEAMAQRITWCSGRRSTCTARCWGGRLFEAYSEDPLLTGTLAAA
jgi:beta-glucosidase